MRQYLERCGRTAFFVAAAATALGLALCARSWSRGDEAEEFNEDFEKCLLGVRRLAEGRDPYAGAADFKADLIAGLPPKDIDWKRWFTYPPLVLLLLWPAAALPDHTAGLIWFGLNVVMLAAGIWLAGRAINPKRAAAALAVMAVAAVVWPIRYNFWLGNSEVMLFFLVASAGWALTRGRDSAAGALLGLAASIKIFPGFHIAALLVAGRVRAAVAGVLAAAVFTAAGALWAGPGSIEGFRTAASIKTESPNGFAAWPHSQSFNSFLHRQWVPNTANALFAPSADRHEIVPYLVYGWAALVMAAWLAIEWRGRGRWTPLSLGFGAATLVLANPTAESYYAAALLLPLVSLVDGLADRLPNRGWGLLAGTAVSLYLVGLRAGNWRKETAAAPYVDTLVNNLAVSQVWLGEIGLWICLACLRWSETSPSSASPLSTGSREAVGNQDGPR